MVIKTKYKPGQTVYGIALIRRAYDVPCKACNYAHVLEDIDGGESAAVKLADGKLYTCPACNGRGENTRHKQEWEVLELRIDSLTVKVDARSSKPSIYYQMVTQHAMAKQMEENQLFATKEEADETLTRRVQPA